MLRTFVFLRPLGLRLLHEQSLFEAKYNMREGKGDIIKTDREGIT
ncbi:hypothetical protein PTB13_09995 [Bacillus sp. MHSD17]|nr:hypothetical protein [Bacillus sp. MHSD17]